MHKFIEQVRLASDKNCLLRGDTPCSGEEGFDREWWDGVKCIEQFGGEGKGDDIWAVYEVDGKFFKASGWYASYSGSEYSDVIEVVNQPVMKNNWVKA
jgi:hypothetical protein